EGLNSVMQLARSRARGFRNIDNFCNMIYFLGNH
ncbi:MULTISPECIES: transposase, partial [unclassified Polaribacter]